MNVYDKIDLLLQMLFTKNDKIKFKQPYSEYDLKKMPTETIDSITEKYNLREKVSDIADNIVKRLKKNAHQFENYEDFSLALSNEITKEVLRLINKTVEIENDKIKAEKRKITISIGKLNDVKSELKKEKVDIDKINSLIDETILEDDEKDNLKSQALEYANEKNKEYDKKIKEKEERAKFELLEKQNKTKEEKEEVIEEKFKLFDINNYKYIEKLLNEYKYLFNNDLFQMQLEECFDNVDLQEILNFHYNEIDDDLFSMAFITLLAKIDRSSINYKIIVYANALRKLCEKYELYNSVKDISSELKNFYTLYQLDDDDSKELLRIQKGIIELENNKKYNDNEVRNLISIISESLHKLRRKKITENLNDTSNLSIKAFILFDYSINEACEMEPYILQDLDESSNRTLIDTSLDRAKIELNGYNDFNDLIDDILINGVPKSIMDSNDKNEKLIRPVYYTDNGYKSVDTRMKNATGMYRIRPRITSYVRFIDEMFILIPGTKKFEQIISILESKLSNIEIDRNKPFKIYINVVDAFKLGNTDSYMIAINRQKKSRIIELLNMKDEYKDSELEELSEAIDMTINTYKNLCQINSSFNFEVINKITKNDTLTQ